MIPMIHAPRVEKSSLIEVPFRDPQGGKIVSSRSLRTACRRRGRSPGSSPWLLMLLLVVVLVLVLVIEASTIEAVVVVG
jgi:hypothetical protein